MFSSILMVLLALCVLAAGILILKRELTVDPPVFTSEKEAKEEMLGLFQDRGFFYLTALRYSCRWYVSRQISHHLIFFRHFWQVQACKLFFI